MKTNMVKNTILLLNQRNVSHKEIARTLGISRTTVIKYTKQNEKLERELKDTEEGSAERHRIMEEIAGAPKYSGKGKSRKKRKYTEAIDSRIDEILADEERKDRTYGPNHKIRRTAKQIFEILEEEGFDISYSTVSKKVREKRHLAREVFIKQNYASGERAEFDYGERTITIAGKKTKVYVALIVLPISGYRDFYVYPNSKTETFVDAQVRFFERIGGVPRTVVYDNMKNVVKRFVGRNERELTETVLSLSNYYKFEIKLTNPYSGNEKGTVEASVKVVLRDLFARKDQFKDWDELIAYVNERKEIMNKNTALDEERVNLMEAKIPYETAEISQKRVNKYGCVRVDKNDYSVPEEYSSAIVTVKLYPHSVEIFYNSQLIAIHRRLFGEEGGSYKLEHYLNTMLRKPGALAHAVALQQHPELYKIFTTYYSQNPKEFLEILIDNKDTMDTDELLDLFNGAKESKALKNKVESQSKSQLEDLVSLFQGRKEANEE